MWLNFLSGMGLRSILARPFANYIARQTAKWSGNPVATQQKVFEQLVKSATQTAFGKDHGFDMIRAHADFVRQVPIRDYETLTLHRQGSAR